MPNPKTISGCTTWKRKNPRRNEIVPRRNVIAPRRSSIVRAEMKNPRQKCNCTIKKWKCTWYGRFLCGSGWFRVEFPEVACDLYLLDTDYRSQTGEMLKKVRKQSFLF